MPSSISFPPVPPGPALFSPIAYGTVAQEKTTIPTGNGQLIERKGQVRKLQFAVRVLNHEPDSLDP